MDMCEAWRACPTFFNPYKAVPEADPENPPPKRIIHRVMYYFAPAMILLILAVVYFLGTLQSI